AIAADVLETLDRLRHLPPELALDRIILLDKPGDPADLVFGQLVGPHARIDLGFLQDLPSPELTNPVNVLKRHVDPLGARNVYTGAPLHAGPLSLSRLVPRIGLADYPHDAAALHHFAPFAYSLHAAANLHSQPHLPSVSTSSPVAVTAIVCS